MIVECRDVRESGINKANCGHCVEAPVRRIPPRTARVGVSVGVKPRRQPFEEGYLLSSTDLESSAMPAPVKTHAKRIGGIYPTAIPLIRRKVARASPKSAALVAA